MGKSTISMAMFNSFLYVYQAGYATTESAAKLQRPQNAKTWKVFKLTDQQRGGAVWGTKTFGKTASKSHSIYVALENPSLFRYIQIIPHLY